MNIEKIESLIKQAMPDAPSKVHDFYMDIVNQITPKKENFTQSFDGRGEADYTMVYQSTRLTILLEGTDIEILPNIDSGLVVMRGTDGSIAVDGIRNNIGLPTQTKSMLDRVENNFERGRSQANGEISTRFMSHGIGQFQFGNTHHFNLNASSQQSRKAIPDNGLHSRGFGRELNARIGREVGLIGVNTTDSVSQITAYMKVLLGLDNDISDRGKEMSLKERSAYLNAIGNMTYYTSTFFDPLVLAAINGNDSQDADLTQNQASLANLISNTLKESYLEAINSTFDSVKEKLRSAANFYPSSNDTNSFEDVAFNNYPTSMLNFIITAKGNTPEETEKVRAHRKLFLDAIATEAGVDLIEGLSEEERSDEFIAFLRKLDMIFDEKKNGEYFIDSIMKHIDDGKIPRLMIADQFGSPYINKKDFRQAMQNNEESLTEALALAKLPKNWLEANTLDGEKVDISVTDRHKKLRTYVDKDSDESTIHTLNSIGYSKVKPYLVRTGQELSRLDDRLAKAAQSNNPEHAQAVKLQVNKEKKVISQQYVWLAKKNDAIDAIIDFDNQYGINSTLSDYERTMSIFLDAIAMRAAYDVAGSDGLSVNDEGKMEIDTEALSSKLYESMLESESEYRYNLDSDHRDYDDEENFIEKPEIHEFSNLFDTCWSVKSAAENNSKLHKSMSSISKKLGEYSTNNVSWTGLVNEPVNINGYSFIPITDRKRLLEEGVIQNHCVYTLLNPCLSGETSVFTIENNQGQVVATMEVHQEDASEGLVHESIQLYGPGNSGVDRSIQDAGNTLIEMLDSGDIEVNFIEEENSMHDYIDNDNVEEIADLQLVPFLTDAIYDAYAVIKRHLPMGTTLSDILESTEGMSDLFYRSESGQAIRAMERLSEIYDLDTDDMVTLAKQSPVRLIMENHNQLYVSAHEATHAREQARIIHQHSENEATINIMQDYADQYAENEYQLWSFIEDNVDAFPEGMDEDAFRRCLRSVIDTEDAEKGMQDFAKNIMQESKNMERQAKRHYDLMVSYLPQGMSVTPLMEAFSEDVQKRIQQLDIMEVSKEEVSNKREVAMAY